MVTDTVTLSEMETIDLTVLALLEDTALEQQDEATARLERITATLQCYGGDVIIRPMFSSKAILTNLGGIHD